MSWWFSFCQEIILINCLSDKSSSFPFPKQARMVVFLQGEKRMTETADRISIREISGLICSLFFILLIKNSDSYYVPYLILTLFGYYTFIDNRKINRYSGTERERKFSLCFSFFMSALNIAANYKLFAHLAAPAYEGGTFALVYSLAFTAVSFLGSVFLWRHISMFLIGFADRCRIFSNTDRKAGKVFLITFGLLTVINLTVLFLIDYPGYLTFDSVEQVTQILENSYTNHHPFFHTVTIKVFFETGIRLFGDINAGIALYNAVQIILMALCFAYVCSTLYRFGLNKTLLSIIVLWYALMPFHITYSITVWKDVLFGGAAAAFAVSAFRLLYLKNQHNWTDYSVMILSGILICLFRSNGWFAFVLSTVCFALMFGRNRAYRNILYGLVAVTLFTAVLKHPLLSYLNVPQPDTIESFSIPVQQISRVVIKHEDALNDEQYALLNSIIDVDQIPEKYQSHISDPIKHLVRDKNNQEFLEANKGEFAKLYIDLGMRYPADYVAAWIDQTRGYWNGGYQYWRWSTGIIDNSLGIEKHTRLPMLKSVYDKYLWMYENNPLLQIFLCIGFHGWILLAVMFTATAKKRWKALFVAAPVFMIVISLLIATPVSYEFRYVYALFCTLPFYMTIVMLKEEKADG